MVTINKRESGTLPLSSTLLSTLGFEIRKDAWASSVGAVVANGVINGTTGVVESTCDSVADPADCVNDSNSIAKLASGDYQLCETGMMPGWTNNIPCPPGFTPLGATPEGGDNSTECMNISLGAGAMGVPTGVPDPIDNTPPPGGDARTIGFWKNWTSCDGKGNQDPVLDQTLAAAGPGGITIGKLTLDGSVSNPDVALTA
jgi:hypothetical protein